MVIHVICEWPDAWWYGVGFPLRFVVFVPPWWHGTFPSKKIFFCGWWNHFHNPKNDMMKMLDFWDRHFFVGHVMPVFLRRHSNTPRSLWKIHVDTSNDSCICSRAKICILEKGNYPNAAGLTWTWSTCSGQTLMATFFRGFFMIQGVRKVLRLRSSKMTIPHVFSERIMISSLCALKCWQTLSNRF